MESKKKIAVFTSARSEYGPLKPLIQSLFDHDGFEVQLLVGGAHFSHEQGFTYQEILEDGFEIHTQLPFLINDLNPAGVVRSNGLLTIQSADYFEREKPDLLIVLGDRSELIPIVSAALILSVPIAHLSGGEVTEGATDNQIRHAVSKMSHVHFPATEIYAQNLMKMGEESWRIAVVGEPSLDSVLSLKLPTKEEFYNNYGIPQDRKLLLATLHSETIQNKITSDFMKQLIVALQKHGKYHLLFTAANTDIGGKEINDTLEEIARESDQITFIRSLGKTNYYAALQHAEVVIGNSSSGLIEAQSFHVPVINVGSRQDGRLRNPNVYEVSTDVSAIIQALDDVKQEKFISQYCDMPNIFGDGKASERIIKFIDELPWEDLILKKSIY